MESKTLSPSNVVREYCEVCPPNYHTDHDAFEKMVADIHAYQESGRSELLGDDYDFRDYLAGNNYENFLKTKYWKIISDEVKRYYRGRCALCYRVDDLHAHHRTYKAHFYEHESMCNLIALCPSCHRKFHNK